VVARAGGRVFRRAIRIAYRDPVALGDLAVDGADLLEAGIPGGPQIGATLGRLLEYVLEDPSRNRRDLLLEEARGGRAAPGGAR
jgi:hypothetical protein